MSRQQSINAIFEKIDQIIVKDYIDPAKFIPIKGIACCVTVDGKIDFIPLFGIHRSEELHDTELRFSVMGLLHEIRTADQPIIPSGQYVDNDQYIEWNGMRFELGHEHSLLFSVMTYLARTCDREIIKNLVHLGTWNTSSKDNKHWSGQDFTVGRVRITKCKYTFTHMIMDFIKRLFKGGSGRTHEYCLYKCDGSLVWSSGVSMYVTAVTDAKVNLLDSLADYYYSPSR